MADASSRRWFVPTPDRLLPVLLAVEGLLFLSAWFRWFPFNQHKGWTMLIAVTAVGVFLLLMFLWFLAAVIFKWRFQFSILSLFVLTAGVALPFAWLETEMKAAREQKAAADEINKLGCRVTYDYERDPRNTTGEPPEPAWLRGLSGDDLFVSVTQDNLVNSRIADAGLEHLKGLPQLQGLFLSNTQVGDAGLEHLKGLTRLQVLYLDDTKVSDAGLEHLKELTQLQVLFLSNTQVGDAGLEHLKGLTQLQVLDLRNTKVSDAGLEHLKGLARLQWLVLNGTKVSDAGVKKLRQAMPNCQIIH